MGIFAVLLLVIELAFFNTGIHSLPVITENPFYVALEKNCTYIKEIPNFKNQTVFDKCTDWKSISATQSLTEDTESNFRCLLYFDSFSMFCSEITRQVDIQSQKSVNISGNYFVPTLNETVEHICKNLSLFPSGKQFGHNVTKVLTKDTECVKLCSTYDGVPRPECSLTHYFSNLDVAQVIAKSMSVGQPHPGLVPDKVVGKSNSLSAAVGSDGHPELHSGSVPHKVVPPIANSIEKKNGTSKDLVQNKAINYESEKNKDGALVPGGAVEPDRAVEPGEAVASGGAVELDEAVVSDRVVAPAGAVVPSAGHDLNPNEAHPNAAQHPSNPEVSANDNTKNVGVPSQEMVSTQGQSNGDVNEEQANKNTNASEDVLEDETGQQADSKVGPQIEMERPIPAQMDPDLDTDLEDNPPIDDDDDEEQPYKKADPEEAEANQEEEESKKGNTAPKKDEAAAEEAKKETADTMDMLPDNIPINSASAGEIDGGSYFFSYFMAICVLFVLGYVGYHNRQKVMALVVEGKRGKRQYRGRRPNSANYHKLDSNLEEAISSSCTKNSSHVIY